MTPAQDVAQYQTLIIDDILHVKDPEALELIWKTVGRMIGPESTSERVRAAVGSRR